VTSPAPALPFGASASPRPLRDKRVVDLSQFIAGSACGQLLADFGAEVTKVEPHAGDPSRGLGRTEHGSAYFRQYNTGKSSLLLDLTDPSERAELERLLGESDALVMNFSPRTMAKHGLDWDALHGRHPDLVVVEVSAYGDGDPRTAFDSIAQAASGFARVNADEAGAPRISAGYPTDVFSGLYAGISAAMTLLDPQRMTGVLVDVPMIEVAMSALCGPSLLAGVETGEVRPGVGNRDIATTPSTTFGCRDGWVYLYAGLDKHWGRLSIHLAGPDEHLDDPLEERLADPDRYEAAVRSWTSTHTVAEVCALANELGIPASPVEHPLDALRDLHGTRPRAVVDLDPSGAAVPQFPVTFSGARIPRVAAPPHARHPTIPMEAP
jgi:crotonobetainyl-CoA:carnitine CoA-transferase CaiB-like acyl-CoA transferase